MGGVARFGASDNRIGTRTRDTKGRTAGRTNVNYEIGTLAKPNSIDEG